MDKKKEAIEKEINYLENYIYYIITFKFYEYKNEVDLTNEINDAREKIIELEKKLKN